MQAFNYMAGTPDLNAQFAGLGEAIVERNKQAKEVDEKAQLAKDLAEAQKAGTTEAYFNLSVKYPKLNEIFSEKRKQLGAETVKNEFNFGAQVSTALENNRPEAATDLLTTRIEAAKAAGKPTDTYQQLLDKVNSGDYDIAKSAANQMLMMASPELFKQFNDANIATATEKRAAELQPIEVQRKQAEAKTAETNATYAESKAQSDLLTAQVQRQAIQHDSALKTQQLALERQRLQMQKEENAAKRADLVKDYDLNKQKFEDKVDEKAKTVLRATDNIDSGLSTIQAIRSHIKENPAAFSRTFGPIASKMPTVTQSSADLEALLKTAKSQALLVAVPQLKGMGAMSDKDAKFLATSITNLDPNQSTDSFLKALDVAEGSYRKSRSYLEDKYNVPKYSETSKNSSTKPIKVNY